MKKKADALSSAVKALPHCVCPSTQELMQGQSAKQKPQRSGVWAWDRLGVKVWGSLAHSDLGFERTRLGFRALRRFPSVLTQKCGFIPKAPACCVVSFQADSSEPAYPGHLLEP